MAGTWVHRNRWGAIERTPDWVAGRPMIPASEAETGPIVTTECNLGGIGIGHLIDGDVYQSDGNGWYSLASEGIGGLKRVWRDGGQMYRDRINRLFGWDVRP